ncbi:MAG: flavodoxin family protein [Pseudomonadota bacterium]
MKTLIINGSPSGEKGKTWWALERFIQGMEKAGAQVSVLNLAGKNIHYCTGELACWFKTPSQCIHKDDMQAMLPMLTDVRALVLATPVYVDGMSGLLKNFIDRLVVGADPHLKLTHGHTRHVSKNNTIKQIALVSVCGYPELDNFSPLIHHVEAMCKNFEADFSGAILRPQAPALDVAKIYHPLKYRSISNATKQAGQEFIRDGEIKADTADLAAQEIFPQEEYIKAANKEFDKVLKARP